MTRKAASSLRALRSLRLVFTMSMTCLRVTFPTLVLLGSLEPAAMLAAFFKRIAAGGLFLIDVNDFFLLKVMTTGGILTACFFVAAVNFLQQDMMFKTPGPSTVPTGSGRL